MAVSAGVSIKCMRKSTNGFTLVELLIVIVVIAILAAITLVTYNGIQKRALDTQRISDINALTKGMQLWTIDTGVAPKDSGAGSSAGQGTGWVYANGYTKNIETMLIEAGFLSSGARDPKTPTGTGSYMFYGCNDAGTMYYSFFARLAAPDKAKPNDFSRWHDDDNMDCPNPVDTYGMNYARIFTAG